MLLSIMKVTNLIYEHRIEKPERLEEEKGRGERDGRQKGDERDVETDDWR